MLTANDVIRLLDLRPLPFEGGYFRETYRSADLLSPSAFPTPYGRAKAAGTAIYYLLTSDTFSAVHRLPTDEVFHLYLGGPVQMLHLYPNGAHQVMTIGSNLLAGERPQIVVPRGVWQGSWLPDGVPFALMGTTMAPGFDPEDFEPADAAALSARYPAAASLIRRLTR